MWRALAYVLLASCGEDRCELHSLHTCRVDCEYGDLGLLRGQLVDATHAYFYIPSTDGTSDRLDVVSSLPPGTYDLRDVTATCGVCIRIRADFFGTSPSNVRPAKTYKAVSGTVTLTSPTSGRADDMHFYLSASEDSYGLDCETTIDAVEFAP